MKFAILMLFATALAAAAAQTNSAPADPKAQKTYADALKDLHSHHEQDALDGFKKANKQDGGRCAVCLHRIISLSQQLGDFKSADAAARELIAQAQDPEQAARAHYERGSVLLREGTEKKKNDRLAEADREFRLALAGNPKDSMALYGDALALARLNRDDEAKPMFRQLADLWADSSVDRARLLRYAERPELARANMAPAFAITTTDGQRLSLDGISGKVLLVDFWATWCGPCREALPHMKQIAQKFKDQPFVVLSVSLDADEQKWKSFVAKNEMTWKQYRDGSFEGPLAKLFGVRAIPQTFTIDADGVLQDQQIGDQAIEGKLKKLVVRAQQLQQAQQHVSASTES